MSYRRDARRGALRCCFPWCISGSVGNHMTRSENLCNKLLIIAHSSYDRDLKHDASISWGHSYRNFVVGCKDSLQILASLLDLKCSPNELAGTLFGLLRKINRVEFCKTVKSLSITEFIEVYKTKVSWCCRVQQLWLRLRICWIWTNLTTQS